VSPNWGLRESQPEYIRSFFLIIHTNSLQNCLLAFYTIHLITMARRGETNSVNILLVSRKLLISVVVFVATLGATTNALGKGVQLRTALPKTSSLMRTEDEVPCFMKPHRDGVECDEAACRLKGGYCRVNKLTQCTMTNMRGREGPCNKCACGGGVNFHGSTQKCVPAARIGSHEQTMGPGFDRKVLRLVSVPITLCSDLCHGCAASPGSNDRTPGTSPDPF